MMERILLVVLFLSGWDISSCLLHQYHYVASPMNWTAARAYCRKTYTDLATIENTEEINQLINSSLPYNSEVWIGLYSKINWTWSDGYRGIGAEYRNWYISKLSIQPDFYFANQFCVEIGSGGAWWDDDCSLAYPFICYSGSQLDPKFVLVSKTMNWSSAQRYCRENFTDLATVVNVTENQKFPNLLQNRSYAWIGLFRDPQIYWSDGSGFSFSYWDNSRNPLGSMTVICGVAALKRSGKWRFIPCETSLPFVCYSAPPAPVKRQVVTLRIKPENSSMDLNDPAVKADILKKFQDRLKNNGVSGVTLKWREQPDGKVFHKEKSCEKKKIELCN